MPQSPQDPGSGSARRPTMEDVAARAGVSITTVSRMLSGQRPVSRATADLIAQAISDLGFRPNATARALRTQRSHDIALMLGNISHEANPLVARGAGEVLRAAGYNLVMYETDGDPDTLVTVMDSIRDRGTDGVIVLLAGSRRQEYAGLIDAGIPLVMAGPRNSSWRTDEVVQIDETAGIVLATEHVLARTSGVIAYIGGPDADPNAATRRDAFIATMRDADRPLDVRHILDAPWSFLGGRDAAEKLLRSTSVDAIVCANDLIAIGAIRSLRDHGLAVPDDVMVTGFDNIEASGLVDPPLTTVEPYEIRLGHGAAHAILARLDPAAHGFDDDARTIYPTLVVRQSAPDTHRS